MQVHPGGSIPSTATMGNFGRRPITDAGKGQPKLTYMFKDEERLDRRPQGRVERFVDPDGGVMSLQLASDGDPVRKQTEDKMRMSYRRKGFVEHAKCPLRHGHHLFAGVIAKDFSKMPDDLKNRACDSDPKVMKKVGHDLYAQNACPHIEWLIQSRKEYKASQDAKRNESRIADEKRKKEAAELQAAQLEMVKEQIEERRARKPKAKPE